MDLSLCVYNMEWMKDLFLTDGSPKDATNVDLANEKEAEQVARSIALADVVRAIDPDLLCITEGPDTLKDGSKTATQQLEAWARHHNLDASYRGTHGFPSRGQQELCALFKSTKVHCEHIPETHSKKNPFNEVFFVDTTDSLVHERYEHFRPPFEMSVQVQGGGTEVMRVIVAHTKSKGIFDSVDLARFEQLSRRNRKRLYAECYSIRERCNQWMKDKPDLPVAVVGDINDGFGLDYYEQRFSRSAVEILLGDVWEPEWILRHALPKPRLSSRGWTPASSSYRDKLTEDRINVLIDHLIVSQSVSVANARVWHPSARRAPDDVVAIKDQLRKGSDHYPISADLTIPDPQIT